MKRHAAAATWHQHAHNLPALALAWDASSAGRGAPAAAVLLILAPLIYTPLQVLALVVAAPTRVDARVEVEAAAWKTHSLAGWALAHTALASHASGADLATRVWAVTTRLVGCLGVHTHLGVVGANGAFFVARSARALATNALQPGGADVEAIPAILIVNGCVNTSRLVWGAVHLTQFGCKIRAVGDAFA